LKNGFLHERGRRAYPSKTLFSFGHQGKPQFCSKDVCSKATFVLKRLFKYKVKNDFCSNEDIFEQMSLELKFVLSKFHSNKCIFEQKSRHLIKYVATEEKTAGQTNK
jgi:hypothetical protein